ncbi:S8 family peptidase [Streptomyces pseudovenezuelae]|uniref:Subtilisin family serine protease n=1 Tax=Streptomyces pseudovenezuelae TaxID=67350 RepID=A0ABT6LZ31_9ACTN|nr:S8 family serine peptidase [Streptomyces pseudovenezuelae]MDH6221553.1 subtilisin family serine protease [Streptomyces pseudovenezuelae]
MTETRAQPGRWAPLTGLHRLTAQTGAGNPRVVVGVVDGPVDIGHPDLADAGMAASAGCRNVRSAACRHGTAVVAMLAARGESPAPGLCPGCTVLPRPVFCEAPKGGTCPALRPAELATAVVDLIEAGARIVNLSLGAEGSGLARSRAVDDAFDHAQARGVLVVVAAGNHGQVGPAPLMAHPWPVLVAACDQNGRPLPGSNLGIGIGLRGLLAPGLGIVTAAPGGGYQAFSGTSAAAPFVTGTAALLWSTAPSLPAAVVRAALLRPGLPRSSVVPPLVDGLAALRALNRLTGRPLPQGP